MEEQYGRLEDATQSSAQFDAFDLNIAALIVKLLSQAPEVLTNTLVSFTVICDLLYYVSVCTYMQHQENFAKIYSNLLLTNMTELAKSQQQFQASSS